jgi:hypothetical protein
MSNNTDDRFGNWFDEQKQTVRQHYADMSSEAMIGAMMSDLAEIASRAQQGLTPGTPDEARFAHFTGIEVLLSAGADELRERRIYATEMEFTE